VPGDVRRWSLGGAGPAALARLLRLLWRLRPDVVFSSRTFYSSGVLMLRPLAPAGVRFICRENCLPSIHVPTMTHGWAKRRLYPVAHRRADVVVCQCAEMRDDVAEGPPSGAGGATQSGACFAMLETNQLPYLLRLVDDEDPAVRTRVLDALAGFGPDLDAALEALDEPPDPEAVARAKDLLERHVRDLGRETAAPADMAFALGQVVRHRRYGYRGVVVDADPTCQADETWYRSNRTQPKRDQPWYHVLVHNSMQVTYAAESNLDVDDSGDEVVHPYVPYFFSEFRDGGYVRNDQPWPG